MNKAYIIIFDEPGIFSSYDPTKFHTYLTKANSIVDWWHYFKSSYIAIVNRSVTAANIATFLTDYKPNKTYLIVEINLRNHNGLLPQEAWNWIIKHLQ